MSDTAWGKRDNRGEWTPDPLPQPAPIFVWPFKVKAILKFWFAPGGFIWPYNLIFAGLAILSWIFFTPSLERTVSFEFLWIFEIFVRNAVLLIIVAGGFHLRLYTTKGQGLKFKYTDKWMAKNDKRFLFKDQLWDNVFWSIVSGVIIWTLYEALTLWAFSNGKIPFVDWRTHPVYFVFMMFMVVFLRQAHFYFVHRWSHWKPLYKISHYLHHKNINIGPWSGLSMHPLEHLLYFSGVLLHFIIPSHPIHAIFHLMHAGLSPALGHTGFHKFTGKTEKGLVADQYFHYLHHRYFTVNYGVEVVPLDKWFGSFHSGSPEDHELMLKRREGKK